MKRSAVVVANHLDELVQGLLDGLLRLYDQLLFWQTLIANESWGDLCCGYLSWGGTVCRPLALRFCNQLPPEHPELQVQVSATDPVDTHFVFDIAQCGCDSPTRGCQILVVEARMPHVSLSLSQWPSARER